MSFKIGNKYHENLNYIQNFLVTQKFGVSFKNSEIIHLNKEGGKCIYDMCPNKQIKGDEYIIISHDSGRKEVYCFHSACKEYLIRDRRFPLQN